MTMTKIGYARCSTDKQDLTAQRQALNVLGVSDDRIYTDHGLTGTNRARPGLDQALAAVREGDVLIAPGWYGIANVKWLKRIEIRDQRFESILMERDYVTIREEDHNGETVWAETSVGRALLKSAPGRVTHSEAGYRISGAAWGALIARVEVRIDDGAWLPAMFDTTEEAEFAWKMWYLDWDIPTAGKHTITSRAIDTLGNVQPAMDDPWIARKHTYWESNGQITRQVATT